MTIPATQVCQLLRCEFNPLPATQIHLPSIGIYYIQLDFIVALQGAVGEDIHEAAGSEEELGPEDDESDHAEGEGVTGEGI